MDKYIVFVVSVLKGSTFIERKNLNSSHKLFDSPEEAIAAIQDEIKRVYCNVDGLIVSEIEPPRVEKYKDTCIVYGGGFKCRLVAYKSTIFFRIYINSIHMD